MGRKSSLHESTMLVWFGDVLGVWKGKMNRPQTPEFSHVTWLMNLDPGQGRGHSPFRVWLHCTPTVMQPDLRSHRGFVLFSQPQKSPSWANENLLTFKISEQEEVFKRKSIMSYLAGMISKFFFQFNVGKLKRRRTWGIRDSLCLKLWLF